tara:strand:- start:18470 stop:19567 length:1098 start_codon:yes stop_codon:yes gene_type:complete
MISTFLKPILLIAIFSFSSLLVANQFDNPYQGNVMVSSSSESELKDKALIQVLIKVSGNNDIASLAETKLLLKKTQHLVSQYGYQTEQGNKYFSALFDQAKINQSLRDMQQPVWGDTRPTTLIWLINTNQLVSEQDIKLDDDASLSLSLKQTQQMRGIQVQFPLMDLDDNLAVSVSDVRGRFYDHVANATLRYARGHFVVAELKDLGSEKWKLSWQLVQADSNSKQHRILKSDQFIDSKSNVAIKMVNALADYYAGQYAILENKNEKFTQTIYINGINSLDKLAKLSRILDNLLAISSFSISSALGEQVSVDVKIKGSVESFKNTLLAQPNLQFGSGSSIVTESSVSDTSVNEVVNTQALYFNWR